MVGKDAAAQHWFGGLTYSDRGKCLMQRDGAQVALRAKSLAVFKYLSDQPGTVVNKEDLIAAVWPGVTVTDDSLTQCIADIRRVLGKDAHETLRTVPRQGYVLVADEPTIESAAGTATMMAPADRVGDAIPGNPASLSPNLHRFPRRSWVAAALVLVLGGAWLGWANWPTKASVTTAPAPHPHAPSLHLVVKPTTDPKNQSLLDATIGEFRSALARYPTIKLAERPDTDYRLSFSLAAGVNQGFRLQVDGVDLRTDAVFMSQSLDIPEGDDAARRLGIRLAAFASPGGGALARHLLETSRHKPADNLSRAECYAHGYACTTCSGDTPSVSKRAKTCLAKILKEDPADATAWALKSTIHTHQYRWGHGLTEPERSNLQARTHWRDKAVEAANRAESLSNGADTAIYWAMAQAYSATCEIDKLKAVIERGLIANPNDPSLMAAFGNWLGTTGEWEAGAALVERAFELEPEFHQSWWIYAIGKKHYERGEYQLAYDAFLKTFNDRNWLSHMTMTMTLPYLGRHDEAIQAAERLQHLFPGMTVEKALQHEKGFCTPNPMLAKMKKGMLMAGLPSRGSSENLDRVVTPPAKIIKINGIPIEYMDMGDGEPILFVHGATADYRAWGHYEVPISENHRFIAYTQRFFGTQNPPVLSDEDMKKISLETFAQDLASFIEQLKVGPVHVVTWSFGGAVATYLSVTRPDLFKSAIHFEPIFGRLSAGDPTIATARTEHQKLYGPMVERMKANDIQGAGMRFIEASFEENVGGFDDENVGFKRVILENSHTLLARGKIGRGFGAKMSCEFLKQSQTPTLIVRGEETNPYWTHNILRFSECIPGSQVATLPGVKHDGPLRLPKEFSKIIVDFVDLH